MGFPYIRDSFGYKRLLKIAKRLDGHVAAEFFGITVGNVNVLYRHGTEYMQPRKGREYGRWNWDIPFGREADWEKVDYVLLHGPKTDDAKETFFPATVNEARRFAEEWPIKLNFQAHPLRNPCGMRAEFWKLRSSLREVRHRLSGKLSR